MQTAIHRPKPERNPSKPKHHPPITPLFLHHTPSPLSLTISPQHDSSLQPHPNLITHPPAPSLRPRLLHRNPRLGRQRSRIVLTTRRNTGAPAPRAAVRRVGDATAQGEAGGAAGGGDHRGRVVVFVALVGGGLAVVVAVGVVVGVGGGGWGEG